MEKLKKSAWQYYLGLLLLIIGSTGIIIMGTFSVLIVITGAVLVFLSNKHLFIKWMSVLVIPVVAVYATMFIVFSG